MVDLEQLALAAVAVHRHRTFDFDVMSRVAHLVLDRVCAFALGLELSQAPCGIFRRLRIGGFGINRYQLVGLGFFGGLMAEADNFF